MPLIDIHVIEGVFDTETKTRMIQEVTETMVAIEGEAMRGITWVRIKEIAQGEWGIGGQTVTANDMKSLATKEAA